MAIFLHMPSESELSYRRFLIADEATMAYNWGFGDHGGCTYRRTPEEVRCWYRKWNHGSKNFYAYILRAMDRRPVGEVALSGASEQPMVNVLIETRYRGGVRLCGIAAAAGICLLRPSSGKKQYTMIFPARAYKQKRCLPVRDSSAQTAGCSSAHEKRFLRTDGNDRRKIESNKITRLGTKRVP